MTPDDRKVLGRTAGELWAARDWWPQRVLPWLLAGFDPPSPVNPKTPEGRLAESYWLEKLDGSEPLMVPQDEYLRLDERLEAERLILQGAHLSPDAIKVDDGTRFYRSSCVVEWATAKGYDMSWMSGQKKAEPPSRDLLIGALLEIALNEGGFKKQAALREHLVVKYKGLRGMAPSTLNDALSAANKALKEALKGRD